uniref:Uncharacterized protein n=1 Tax=Fagus sylvatica TaxID=28930 RepID=A0A2N9FKH8_FAGSY
MSSTSSSSTTESSPTISNTSAAPTSLPHIQHLITIKLNRDNYLLCKAQIVPYLRGQHLYGFIDGTKPAPPSSLAVPASGTTAKGDSSMADFYHKFTSLANTLAAIDKPLNDFDLVSFFLARLGSDYDALVTAIQQHRGEVTLDELYGDFLSHELHLAQHQSFVDLSLASANFTNRSFSNHGGRGGKSSTPSASSNYGRSFPSNQQRQHRGRGHGRGNYNNSPRPVCQVCTKPGHSALTCYHSDSGATHHLTSDLANLNVRADEYHGPDQIRVGSRFGKNTVMRAE